MNLETFSFIYFFLWKKCTHVRKHMHILAHVFAREADKQTGRMDGEFSFIAPKSMLTNIHLTMHDLCLCRWNMTWKRRRRIALFSLAPTVSSRALFPAAWRGIPPSLRNTSSSPLTIRWGTRVMQACLPNGAFCSFVHVLVVPFFDKKIGKSIAFANKIEADRISRFVEQWNCCRLKCHADLFTKWNLL